MTCQTAPRPFAFAPGLSIVTRLAHLVRRLPAISRARRLAVEGMRALDDRMLADIGLDRSDVEAALAAPWDVDPTVVLSVRRRRRRDAERAGRAIAAPRQRV